MSALEIVQVVFLGLLGAAIGSFLNVVIYRLPRECLAVSKGRSYCPRCGGLIAWFDNLPVISWALLGGRSRCCKERISARYPGVELLTAALFVWLGFLLLGDALATPLHQEPGLLLTWAVAALITSALISLSFIDYDFRILPNEITLSGMVLGPLLAFAAPDLQPGEGALALAPEGWGHWAVRTDALASGVLGVVLSAGVLWGVGWIGAKAFNKPAMGLGDVKMIGAMGGVLGPYALFALVVAAIVGSVIGILVMLVKKTRYIPFGPFLAIGMWLVMLWGEDLWSSYLEMLSPPR